MLAGLQCGNGNFTMGIVRCPYNYRIQIFFDQFAVIRKNLSLSPAVFFICLFREFLINVTKSSYLHIIKLFYGWKKFNGGYASASDNAVL